MADKFLTCLLRELGKAQGYGKKKISEAKDEYNRQVEYHTELGLGLNDARTQAMDGVLKALDKTKLAKQAKITATANKISEAEARFVDAETMKVPWFKDIPAVKAYHALRSMVESDVRLKTSEHNYVAEMHVAENNMFRMFRNQIDEFSRNWIGQRRGSVENDADTASEVIKPGSTSNVIARDIAKAMRQVYDYAVSEMNLHGVTLDRMEGSLPFHPVGAKLANKAEFLADVKNHIDWQRSGAGRFIRPSERDEWLEKYFDAARTGKWDNMDRPFEYTGGEFARDFQNDRFIQFKDGQSYMAMNKKYMDGGMLGTTLHSVQKLAHNIGVIKIFGPSPSHTAKLFRDMAETRVHAATPVGKNPKKINKYLTRYDVITDIALRRNSMDPESALGMFTNGTANLMTSAMLTQASFLSIPGDIATAIANRLANNEPVLRVLTTWADTMAKIKTSRREMLAAGHAASEFTTDSFMDTRYALGAQYGPAWTKAVADKTMRLNFMNRGFDAMRGADTRLRSISLYEARGQTFANIRERAMLERNGITEAEWKRTAEAMQRKTFSPADDINMFRPIDHFDTLGTDLVHKWQRMFYNEGRRSVIENTIEARAMMQANLRADSLAGAVLGSFAKFHGYPTTFFLAMARAALAADTPGKVAWSVARTGLLVTVAAAMGMQAKNYWQGKEFQDPRSAEFWIKASMSSGAFSLWGDFVTGGMRADSATSIVKSIGGPFAQMVGDATSLFVGSPFQAMDIGEHSGNWTLGKTGVEAVDFFRKYLIPEAFFTASIVQRNILEPLQESMSPETMARRYKGQKGFATEAGTSFKDNAGPGSRNPFPMIPGG